MKKINLKIYRIALLGAVALALIFCAQKQTISEKSVKDVMDDVISRIYSTMDSETIESIDQEKAMKLFDDGELEVLATRHWVFNANVPVVVSVMRSTRQQIMPFWLEPSGFRKTGFTIKNEQNTYEVWQKSFNKGTVGLGINGFENFSYHYFVSVAPQNPEDKLELSGFIPENQIVSTLDNGNTVYQDWTELVTMDVPEEMKGQILLTTIRGRGKESHLIGAFRPTAYPSSADPDQIMLTWSSNPSTSMDIQWRTDTSVETGSVKYRIRESADVKTQQAEKFVMEDREVMNDRFIHRFTAKLHDLQPGTEYEYLIPPETDWTKAENFSTPADDDSFSFIWFGDAHQKTVFGELHEKAEASFPETAFYTVSGDMVDYGLYRNEWDNFFENSKNVIRKKPQMNVPGNHDNRLGLGAKMFRDLFSYPTNGPDGVPKEQTYSFTYKNTLFLMLDATSSTEAQTQWIEQQLATSDATWKIAIFHFSPYNFEEPYPDIQEAWVPLFDKYHVDLVLGGHLHYYMRSNPMKAGKVVDSHSEGTTYIISIAIPARHNDIGEEPYAAVRYKEGQFYQHFKIEGNELIYSAFDFDENLVDSFKIKK